MSISPNPVVPVVRAQIAARGADLPDVEYPLIPVPTLAAADPDIVLTMHQDALRSGVRVLSAFCGASAVVEASDSYHGQIETWEHEWSSCIGTWENDGSRDRRSLA
jgi:hypothetical protein